LQQQLAKIEKSMLQRQKNQKTKFSAKTKRRRRRKKQQLEIIYNKKGLKSALADLILYLLPTCLPANMSIYIYPPTYSYQLITTLETSSVERFSLFLLKRTLTGFKPVLKMKTS